MADNTTVTWAPANPSDRQSTGDPVFVIVACLDAPDRVGEVAFLPGPGDPPQWIGRHGTLRWMRHRPGLRQPTGPLEDPNLSRRQLEVSHRDGAIHLLQTGRLPLYLNHRPVDTCTLTIGDLVLLGDRVLLLATLRPRTLSGPCEPGHVFGQVDSMGFVGESARMWGLRDRVRTVARGNAHVLVLGPSGSGKEIVARSLHALSPRRDRPLVSRSAKTIPDGLADAELFGNLANYPNPGMPVRPGLVGEADGSSLFLDEFGELPEDQQARLLRVLDNGEYTRLGEARPRNADIRLLAATNRDLSAIKHDMLARFPRRLDVPGLAPRLEDIPLLAAHLVRSLVRDDPVLAQGVFPDGDVHGTPRLTAALVTALITHPYSTHVRELLTLLYAPVEAAVGGIVDLPPVGLPAQVVPPSRGVTGFVDPASLDPAVVQAALDRNGGRQEPTWRELRMASRHVLARFVKKHGLRVRGRS